MEKLDNSWNEITHNRQAVILCKMARKLDLAEREEYYKLALQHLNIAIERSPNYTEPHIRKAHILEHLGDYEEALSCFESIDLEKTGDLNLYLDKGRLHTKLGDFDEGIKCFDFAISLKPTFTDAYIEKADAFFVVGDFEKAAECYRSCLMVEGEKELV